MTPEDAGPPICNVCRGDGIVPVCCRDPESMRRGSCCQQPDPEECEACDGAGDLRELLDRVLADPPVFVNGVFVGTTSSLLGDPS